MSDVTLPPKASMDSSEAASIAASRDDAPVRIHVCMTCTDRRSGPGQRAGRRLFYELIAKNRDPGVEVLPIECLCICRPNCALSFAAEGKWTYVFAVPSDTNVASILEGARLYAEAPAGVVRGGKRPDILKSGVVARVPPIPGGERKPIGSIE